MRKLQIIPIILLGVMFGFRVNAETDNNNSNLKVITIKEDWRSPKIELPWSEPLRVVDNFSNGEPTVFDKNYVKTYAGSSSGIESGFITRWTKNEIGVSYYQAVLSCFISCYASSNTAQASIGNVLEIAIGGKSYRVYGEKGYFPVSTELSDGLRNAADDEVQIKINIGPEKTITSAIGPKTVKAWKSIYIPEIIDNTKYDVISEKASEIPISTEEIVKRAITGVVQIKTKSGSGTGFLLGSSGLILTNRHVVSGDEAPGIVFYDNELKPAKVLKRDGVKDIALLSVDIKAGQYKGLPICNRRSGAVGSEIVVIGNPLEQREVELSSTVTRGIISGIRDTDNQTLIQTDAAINSGNSGGPMLNKFGAVIGIVNAKIGKQGVAGIGFAIPTIEALSALNIKLKSPQNSNACGGKEIKSTLKEGEKKKSISNYTAASS